MSWYVMVTNFNQYFKLSLIHMWENFMMFTRALLSQIFLTANQSLNVSGILLSRLIKSLSQKLALNQSWFTVDRNS